MIEREIDEAAVQAGRCEPEGYRGGDAGLEAGAVIRPTGAVQVMVAPRPVDFRKGADGSAARAGDVGADPF